MDAVLLLLGGFVFCAGLMITVMVLLLVALTQKNRKIATLERENDRLRKTRDRESDFPQDRPPSDAFSAD